MFNAYAQREEIYIKTFEKEQKKLEAEKKKSQEKVEDYNSVTSDVRKRKNPNYKRVQVIFKVFLRNLTSLDIGNKRPPLLKIALKIVSHRFRVIKVEGLKILEA